MNAREAAKQVLDNLHVMVAEMDVIGKVHFKMHHVQLLALIATDEVCPITIMAAAMVMLEKLVEDEKAVADIMKQAPKHS